MRPILRISDLNIDLLQNGNSFPLVENVDLSIFENEIVGLVGESGSGKTLTALSILNLHRSSKIKMSAHKIYFQDRNLLEFTKKEMGAVAGKEISMIFQDPMTSLNPLMKIGNQLGEMISLHQNISKHEKKTKIMDILNQVGFPDPEKRLKQYPHQLSGGLQQRVMIAMALINKPRLLIADEPTTALDVTTQAQILSLILKLKGEFNLSVLFISHDLLLVEKVAHRVNVMYAGMIIESGSAQEIFRSPRHPYTSGLLKALPRIQSTKPVSAIPGNIPNMAEKGTGCLFANRCTFCRETCLISRPPVTSEKNDHFYRCFFPLQPV